MSRLAAFDIGTNTVRLLVIDPADGTVVRRDHRVVRLGEGVDATGRFAPAAVDRSVRGLAELREAAGDATVVAAVATSAARDAANRDEFLDRAGEVLGLRPRVISGDEEARLSFLGATGGTSGDVVGVVDVGGGSTEVVVGRNGPDYAISVDVGSVRLTERVLPERPAPRHRVDAALAWALDRLSVVAPPMTPTAVYGVGGTFTALGAIDADLPHYDRSVVHGWRLTRQRMESVVGWLASLDLAETEAIPSLEPARAPMLLGGAVTVLAVMTRLEVDAVEVRETDILDGLVMEATDRR